MAAYFVYMLASQRHGTLYTGVTNDLVRRVYQHRTGEICAFTHRYGVKRLVWFERHAAIDIAIRREKRVKRWRRAWKIRLVETVNPDWWDLYDELCSEGVDLQPRPLPLVPR